MAEATLPLLLLPASAVLLDRCIGDPRPWPHPVQAIGALITVLRRGFERWAGDRPRPLRLSGLLICALVVAISAGTGLLLERLALWSWSQGLLVAGLGSIPLVLGLASSLAGRSLRQAIEAVLGTLPDQAPDPTDQRPGNRVEESGLESARRQLAWIVGRDTEGLSQKEILRALAETASENAVDGLFAPLFWLLVGSSLWLLQAKGMEIPELLTSLGPGPLSLTWGFKAASTLDSMLGYREGRLRWLGTAGARLDDLLTWIPCRLVAFSLPLASGHPRQCWPRWRLALREGRPDPSPNAGVSQAAFALAVGVRLGGSNRYRGQEKSKPLLLAWLPAADRFAVERMLRLSDRLESLWLGSWTIMAAMLLRQA